jgi:hypothetical protein
MRSTKEYNMSINKVSQPSMPSAVDGSMRKIVAVLQLAGDEDAFRADIISNPLKALNSRSIDLNHKEEELLLHVLDVSVVSDLAEASKTIDPSWLKRLLEYKDQMVGK